jgi:hypothetical protein
MFWKSLATLALGFLGISLTTNNAIAATTTIRDTDTVYRTGLAPDSTVQVELVGTPITKTVFSDACGVLKVSLGDSFPTNLKVNGTTISPYINQGSQGYKCVGTTAQYAGTAPTASYRTSNASSTNNVLYVVPVSITGGAKKASLITYSATVKKTLKANRCGVLTVRGTARDPFTATSRLTISNDYSPITFGDIAVGTPPVCQNGSVYTANPAAATVSGASLYRTDKAIYQIGLAPNSLSVVQFDAYTSKSFGQYRSNGLTCGVFALKFKTPVTGLKIGSTTYDLATMPTVTAGYDCTVPSTLNKFQVGTLYKYDATLFFYRDPALTKLNVEYPSTVTKNWPVNACGFVTIDSPNRASGFSATDTVKINGTQYSVSAIPIATKPPICRNGVLYQST